VARIVLIPQVTVHSTIPLEDLINFFALAGMDLQWEYPFGTTYNGIIAMMTRRYMHESGTTAEEMAAVVVSLRKWAALDPNSMFYQKPVPTIEKVLGSDMVSSPLHKREGNILADGGAAMVVTSAELAQQIAKTPVYKLGEGSSVLARYFVTTQRGRRRRRRRPTRRWLKQESPRKISTSGISISPIPWVIPPRWMRWNCANRDKLGRCSSKAIPGRAGSCPGPRLETPWDEAIPARA
jgi:acetyl-CoA acetyltransferase